MADHLRVAGGAGGEVEEHRVGDLGREPFGEGLGFFGQPVKVEPALLFPPDDEPDLEAGVGCHSLLDVGGGTVLGGSDNRRDAGALEPVDIVLRGEEVGRRDRNRADLMQPEDRRPELVMAL